MTTVHYFAIETKFNLFLFDEKDVSFLAFDGKIQELQELN